MSYIYKPTDDVQSVLSQLSALGLTNSIVGGVLRSTVLGGETSDIDIAVLCNTSNIDSISSSLNSSPVHIHCSEYSEQSGFLADWRLYGGTVNVIAYNQQEYPTLNALVDAFDININSFLWDAVSGIINLNGFDGKNVKPCSYGIGRRTPDRIKRFVREYPDLNWTEVLLDAL